MRDETHNSILPAEAFIPGVNEILEGGNVYKFWLGMESLESLAPNI